MPTDKGGGQREEKELRSVWSNKTKNLKREIRSRCGQGTTNLIGGQQTFSVYPQTVFFGKPKLILGELAVLIFYESHFLRCLHCDSDTSS